MGFPPSARNQDTESNTTVRAVLILENEYGLHARPAALLVNTLKSFECDVFVEAKDHRANGKSLLGLLSLAAGHGSTLTFIAIGRDASKAIRSIKNLFAQNFSEVYTTSTAARVVKPTGRSA